MLFLAFGDDDIASEDKPKRSRYLSKKDLLFVSIAVVVLVPLLLYFYFAGKGKADDAYCRQNLHQIGVALMGYSEQNDGRLPPTHNMDPDGGPAQDPGTGLPVTWATNVQPFMSTRNDFWCRTTTKEEGIKTVAGKEGQTELPLSYGFYRGLSTVPINQIANPAESFVVAESSNGGANGSFDPTPFGEGQPDGFLIGWDDANLEFTSKSKFVTRLAFSKAGNGYSNTEIVGRHGLRVNAVTVEGNYRPITPDMAKVEHARPRLKGRWWADPNLYK